MTPVVVIWVALAVVGVTVMWLLHRNATTNKAIITRMSGEHVIEHRIAERDLRTANRRLRMEVAFLLLGLLTLFSPAPEHTTSAAGRLFAALLLILVQIDVIRDAVLDYRDQQFARSYQKRQRP